VSDDAVCIDTARVHMRTMIDGDEELYCDLFCDPTTMQFIGAPWSRERASQNFARVLDSMRRRPVERMMLTMLDRRTQHAIGICTLQRIDPRARSAELGLMLRPGWHTKGIATEATVALISWGFATYPIDEIWVQIAADLAAGERIVTHLGFSRRESEPAWQIWYIRREVWATRMDG
jgi:RimJ/RimL family protein N-acetyltransferase